MRLPTRLGLFAAALATVFALGLGIGAAVGPIDDAGRPPSPPSHQVHDGQTP